MIIPARTNTTVTTCIQNQNRGIAAKYRAEDG
jgi:hypothetical protein